MLLQGQMLTDQFNLMQNRLDAYQENNSGQIQQIVNEVNRISTSIAQINLQLTATPNVPNLLDARDELLHDLAKYTEVTVVNDNEAGISVAIGNGQMIVMGSEQSNLIVNPDPIAQFGTQILLSNGVGQVDITSTLHSGMIGGLLDYEENILGYTSQLIGQMAIGLATSFNSQHQLGMDMNNQIGQNFFIDYNQPNLQLARSLPWTNNTGTGVLSVAISDISQTEISDYQLVVTDAATNQVTLTRQSDGQMTTLNWTSSPPTPPSGQIVIDGMTITVDNIGNLANNDSYTISPTRGAAAFLELNIIDPSQIALASLVRTQKALTNMGTGNIALGQVLNSTSVADEYSIQFISPTEYNIVDVTTSTTTGPFTFTPNTDNTVMIPDSANPSYSIVLSGIPQTGDSFTASYNTGGFGDFSNGSLLGAVQQNGLFDEGSENLFDKYADLISGVAGLTYQARLGGETGAILYQQAELFRDSKSGVNVDEEVGNLLRFEQAYQAASKVMAVSGEIMDMLFAAMR